MIITHKKRNLSLRKANLPIKVNRESRNVKFIYITVLMLMLLLKLVHYLSSKAVK